MSLNIELIVWLTVKFGDEKVETRIGAQKQQLLDVFRASKGIGKKGGKKQERAQV